VSRLVVERYTPTAHGWRSLGELGPDGPPGSLSHNPPDGDRELVVFECHGDHSTIARSVLGVDYEAGPLRGVGTAGLETIARLGPGQKLELLLVTDGARMPQRVRFTHSEDG
jgi:hypothetical protein